MNKECINKILIIDDEENTRIGLCRLLHSEGYNVSSAGNGQEALERLASEYFPLVISDLNMPVMNGIDFLKSLHEIQPKTKVVMITAYGDVESYLQAMSLGASEYLHKPVKLKDLKSVMQKLVNKPGMEPQEA